MLKSTNNDKNKTIEKNSNRENRSNHVSNLNYQALVFGTLSFAKG